MLKPLVTYIRLILLAFIFSGAYFQTVSTFIEQNNHPVPGKFVLVNGHNMHIHKMGSGTTNVVLDAGLALNSLDWALVQPQIASFATVYSYDRAGLGWSDPSPAPRTSLQMVQELHSLLHAHVDPPYILVGHSSGGANILMYAILYPQEVSGLVFVDSVHEKQSQLLPPDPALEWIERMNAFSDPHIGKYTTPFGISRFFLRHSSIHDDLHSFPEDIKQAYFARINTIKFSQTAYQEDLLFEESLSQLAQLKTSIPIPLVVITAGSPIDLSDPSIDEADKIWAKLQQEICDLSPTSYHLYAENSDHMIPWHQPEIVAEAVKLLIDRASK